MGFSWAKYLRGTEIHCEILVFYGKRENYGLQFRSGTGDFKMSAPIPVMIIVLVDLQPQISDEMFAYSRTQEYSINVSVTIV